MQRTFSWRADLMNALVRKPSMAPCTAAFPAAGVRNPRVTVSGYGKQSHPHGTAARCSCANYTPETAARYAKSSDSQQ